MSHDTLYANTREEEPRISPEEASRIQQAFEIRVYGGVHGRDYNPQMPLTSLVAPPEASYSAIDEIVGDLEPGGDALFTEGIMRSWPRTLPEVAATIEQRFGASPLGARIIRGEASAVERAQYIADARRKRAVNAWTYAQLLAAQKGVEVHVADIQPERWKERRRELGAHLGFVTTVREQEATQIVLRWARDHLPAEPPQPGSEKRQIRLLFGDFHRPALERRFREAGVPVSAIKMPGEVADVLREKGSQALAWLGRISIWPRK